MKNEKNCSYKPEEDDNDYEPTDGKKENEFDIEIYTIPDVDTVRKHLGYEEYEQINPDVIELQQGIDIDTIEIEEDGTFKILEGYYGQIESEQEFYELVQIDEDYYEKEPLNRIEPGRYKIEGDTIKKIDDKEIRFRY
jgi:hypothetical protein